MHIQVGICDTTSAFSNNQSRRHLQRKQPASYQAVAFIVNDVDRCLLATRTKVLWAWYVISHRLRCVV